MPINEDKPNQGSKNPAYFQARGGWIQNSSTSDVGWDNRFGSKDTSFRKTITEEGEVGLYEDRQYEFNENPLFEFAIRFLAASLLDFDLGGDGADDIRKFEKEVNPTFRKELYHATVSSIRDGAGYLLKFYNAKNEIRQFKWDHTNHYRPNWKYRKPSDKETEWDRIIDSDARRGQRRWIELSSYFETLDDDGNTEGSWDPIYYIREYPLLKLEDYRNDKIAMLKLLEDEEFPSGRSIGRSCYQHFKSLNQALKDVMAVIKKMLGTPLAAALNFDDVDDEVNPDTGVNRRKEAADAFQSSIQDINWEKSDIITFDQKHDIGYIGLLSNSSPMGDGKIIDIMKHMEPVLSAVLLNFFIPLGLVEQTGANKSIIAQQTLQARKDMIPIKEAMKSFLLTQVYPHITDKDVDIYYPPNGVSYEMWNTFFQTGLISREFTTDILGIVDHGDTFVPT